MRDDSARLVIEGPVGLNEVVDDFQVNLYNAQSARLNAQTETNQQTVPGEDSEDTILAPLTGSRSVRLEGDTSFSRINRSFPSLGMKESVRRWIRKLEALVLPTQGLGWKVTDTVRGVTYQPIDDSDTDSQRGLLIDDVEWSYNPEESQRVSWSVSGEFSEGVQNPLDPNAYLNKTTPKEIFRDQLEVGGTVVDLTYVEERRINRSIQLNNTDLIHQTEGESPITGVFDSGVEAEVSFRGTIHDADSFESTVQWFDTEIQGSEAELFDEFAGRVWTGTIADSSSTINAAEPSRFEFDITLEIGKIFN